VQYLNLKSGALSATLDPAIDEEQRKAWRLVRHGYGMQLYNG
jgi:hypothetical protein